MGLPGFFGRGGGVFDKRTEEAFAHSMNCETNLSFSSLVIFLLEGCLESVPCTSTHEGMLSRSCDRNEQFESAIGSTQSCRKKTCRVPALGVVRMNLWLAMPHQSYRQVEDKNSESSSCFTFNYQQYFGGKAILANTQQQHTRSCPSAYALAQSVGCGLVQTSTVGTGYRPMVELHCTHDPQKQDPSHVQKSPYKVNFIRSFLQAGSRKTQIGWAYMSTCEVTSKQMALIVGHAYMHTYIYMHKQKRELTHE